MQMGKSSSTFIDPRMRIPDEASKIHNIYDKDVIGKPTFETIIPRRFPYLSSRLVVIHNLKFDMRMISQMNQKSKGKASKYLYVMYLQSFKAFVSGCNSEASRTSLKIHWRRKSKHTQPWTTL